jgi:RHS repeat-associated protein
VNGNVIGLFTGSSSISERETYAPWGALEAGALTTLADTNRLRWKGLVWEGDSTQLYYVRARWYDPVSRRFVSEDPLGIDGGSNPYVYGGSNPVTHRDHSGMLVDDGLCDFGWETCPPMDSDPFLGNGGYGPVGDQAWQCDVQTLGAEMCLEEANAYLSGEALLGPEWSVDQRLVLDAESIVNPYWQWPSVRRFSQPGGEPDMIGCPRGETMGVIGGGNIDGDQVTLIGAFSYRTFPSMIDRWLRGFAIYSMSLEVTSTLRRPSRAVYYSNDVTVQCRTGAWSGVFMAALPY